MSARVPHTTSLFGTLGSCTCGFADVPAELPCEVHDSLEVSVEHPGALSNLPHDEPEELPDSFFDDDKRERDDTLDEFDGEPWS